MGLLGYDFLLPLHPASEERARVEKRVDDECRGIKGVEIISNKICGSRKDHYLCSPVRKERGAGFKDWQIEGLERKEGRKNKIILFGSSEKISTFALPTEREGKKESGGGCHDDYQTRLKQTKNKLRRIRLKRTEV
ncbi:hypothetical protein [Pedobacter sp. AJM]|uniref:hypothetical protein n=1 Tax=Pedobacter sp. AJM TaxID=2003629 RepID=UPI000B4B6394|nr:hypothetical protein [Pedobacter sp. AJM]OWK68705.1 hypothetical protein CBW18_20875 [Pedobacter sp. AJM]